MTPKPRIDVFISSTSIDLPEYRAAVRDAILTLGLYPSGMENWTVQDESSFELCKRKVDEAEIFVGIYAYRYGWCPPGHDGKSITELEYDWATARGIPRLCFVMHRDHPFPDSRREDNAEAQAKLKAFKDRVQSRVVGYFTTPDNLVTQLLPSLIETSNKLIEELTPPKTVNCNFVPNPEHFVGRTDELVALRKSLSTDGAVTAITALKGIGGIGKTTLACAYANQDDRFQLKLYASLGQNYRENLESSVMETWIGQSFPPGTRLEQMIAYTRQHLMNDGCGTPVLLLIDDVWADTVNAARHLRAAAPPNARVLITTRSEDVAAALDADTTRLDALSPDEGADLMLDLIRDKRAEATRADLKAISVLLDGHSLALTLAARQLRRNFQTRRVKELKDTLEQGLRDGDAFPDLKLERADATSKQDSVSLTLKLTLDALGNGNAAMREKRLKQFRAFGVLPPDIPFRAQHIYAVWGREDAEALNDFVAEGVIVPDETQDDWYSQHRLLRAYARELARANHELEASEYKHQQFIIHFVNRNLNQRPPEKWMIADLDLLQIHAIGNELVECIVNSDNRIIDKELIRLSIDGHITNVRESTIRSAMTFANAVRNYISYRAINLEGRNWLLAGLAAARYLRIPGHIRIFLSALGSWQNQRGNRELALEYHSEALTWARNLGDRFSEAAALNAVGTVIAASEDTEKALEYIERALEIRREIRDRAGEGISLSSIGRLWLKIGDKQKALQFCEEALVIRREIRDLLGEAVTLNTIGYIWLDLQEESKALMYFEQALSILRKVGSPYIQATTLSTMAVILYNSGKLKDAIQLMQNAQDLKLKHAFTSDNETNYLELWQSELGKE
jgi:tetratricopeptide (TPR) repeat protein